MNFDEWFNTYENLQCDKGACEDAFEAGQQSKQKEVDELKNRIDKAICCLKVVTHAHLYEYMDYVINLLDEDEQDE